MRRVVQLEYGCSTSASSGRFLTRAGNLLVYITSALRIHRTSSKVGSLVKYTGVL